MIKFVIGPKGSGKTGKLVDELNQRATAEAVSITCIQRGDRLNRLVKPQVRLIDIQNYPVHGYPELLSFIAGIASKDFDLKELYIDSINKVAECTSVENLEAFVVRLKEFSDQNNFNVTIILSATEDEVPASLKQYL